MLLRLAYGLNHLKLYYKLAILPKQAYTTIGNGKYSIQDSTSSSFIMPGSESRIAQADQPTSPS